LAAALAIHEPVLLHGGLTAADRHEAASAFNSGRSSVLLATDAASEGLNLHRRCRAVVNLELPWTPVRLEQRIGRVDRIGQTRRVHAMHLVASGTTEEDSAARLVAKTARIASAVEGIHPLADSVENAQRRAELRSIAEAEAARLEVARRLNEVRLTAFAKAPAVKKPDTTYTQDARPCVTTSKRRHGHRQSIWIYRLALVDNEQQLVWNTLLGITATLGLNPRHSRNLRALAVSSNDELVPVISRAHQRVFESAVTSMRGPLTLAVHRERAIVDALTTNRARLAATLLQRGLFDRRDERAAAAQTAVVDEALGRCAARIGELDRLERIAAEPAELRFTLLYR